MRGNVPPLGWSTLDGVCRSTNGCERDSKSKHKASADKLGCDSYCGTQWVQMRRTWFLCSEDAMIAVPSMMIKQP